MASYLTSHSEKLAQAVQFSQVGRLNEAVTICEQLLADGPQHADAHHLLGAMALQQGRLAEAVAFYKQALQSQPDHARILNDLGACFHGLQEYSEAIACYRKAIQLEPNFVEAHNNLGNALDRMGHSEEAITCFQQALHLQPNFAEAHANLGTALLNQKRLAEAVASYQKALRLKPNCVRTYLNLAMAWEALGQFPEAIASIERAVQLQPAFAGSYHSLGNAYKAQGELPRAIACYKQALQLEPNNAQVHSALVYTLNFCPTSDSQVLNQELERWNRQHAEPLAKQIVPHRNDPSPDRPLRIGYISPNFAMHPVGRFMLPLLEAHNRDEFKIFCYSSLRVGDEVTERCRAAADVWRDILGLSDARVADIVREDQIDILVDLTMHMADNRLLVFARKPAPVQVTYLAYCGTTGLTAIDYRLTDHHLDPPGQGASCYSERSIYLPDTFWCYEPPLLAPKVADLPAMRNGYVTFGCLNNFCKVTAPTLEAWGQVLRAVPTARLLLHTLAGGHRENVREFFQRREVAPERLIFVDKMPFTEYLETYNSIDVALDPFPYGGGTTTCDALWMGVPVVSLAGQTAVGRGGMSILSNIGLANLVALSVDDYVRLAADLAGDRLRMSDLRASMRARMQASVLTDAPRFARGVEAAFRQMWVAWCAAK